jgi:hypothetical protein
MMHLKHSWYVDLTLVCLVFYTACFRRICLNPNPIYPMQVNGLQVDFCPDRTFLVTFTLVSLSMVSEATG